MPSQITEGITLNFLRTLLILPFISISVFSAEKPVDMADPTAVYSSVGGHFYTDGDFDLSAGFAWGKNMLAVESKQGFDALNVRYAHMNLWNGVGVYAESTVQLEEDLGTTASIGAVSTWNVGKVWTMYPILTIGGMELTEDNWITTGTVGVYNRFKLGHGFSLGLDPFYTFGESDFHSTYVDTFVSYQYKNHQIRVGYNDSEGEFSDFDGEGYIEYKMAF
ncbi:hypothetical protein VIN01S_30910 [Vibrio inusitatus NBRC 102082]|uniref:Outer membrane protein beta-barrel domain-containing protein n=1 Tax=Vibrio inusitatus NBRC 102082 TaxID=1219070 RepID=A0A4Y3HYU7_9VIBR|nr:hypothetical protein [Vibrio inusitatus]GEA52287.1 hypothetical protein VIN01S_30910 [Vibrio inusitatus NBRC 102082]